MPPLRVPRNFNSGIYFITLSVKNLYYLFDRYHRWNILSDSFRYCQKNKGLRLFHFVFMINHIHCIVSSPDIAGFLRDFKRFTSKQLHKNISETEPNILKLFLNENKVYEFWIKTNMPKLIESEEFFLQKANYIHTNPVKRNYVVRVEDWYWSSANPYCELKIDEIEL